MIFDNQINRQDLMHVAELSSSLATKFNKEETIYREVLMRICKVFHYGIGDICQIIED